MLEDQAQFPNNPDFESRKEGFPDARSQRADELARDLDDNETDRLGSELETDEALADKARKSAEKVAKEAPKIPAVPVAGRQAMQKDAQSAPAPKPQPKA
jgi:hypothetical protein